MAQLERRAGEVLARLEGYQPPALERLQDTAAAAAAAGAAPGR